MDFRGKKLNRNESAILREALDPRLGWRTTLCELVAELMVEKDRTRHRRCARIVYRSRRIAANFACFAVSCVYKLRIFRLLLRSVDSICNSCRRGRDRNQYRLRQKDPWLQQRQAGVQA